ncbi:MAG: hypothetical protein ABJ370_09475 [Paracoccaceae bacterium]
MRLFALIFYVLVGPAFADDWVALSGSETRAALDGRKLQYANAWQEFQSSGRTLYNAGRDSWGHWRIEDDQYCSQWPPSDLWACYQLERKGDKLRFVGKGDDITNATYAD